MAYGRHFAKTEKSPRLPVLSQNLDSQNLDSHNPNPSPNPDTNSKPNTNPNPNSNPNNNPNTNPSPNPVLTVQILTVQISTVQISPGNFTVQILTVHISSRYPFILPLFRSRFVTNNIKFAPTLYWHRPVYKPRTGCAGRIGRILYTWPYYTPSKGPSN